MFIFLQYSNIIAIITNIINIFCIIVPAPVLGNIFGNFVSVLLLFFVVLSILFSVSFSVIVLPTVLSVVFSVVVLPTVLFVVSSVIVFSVVLFVLSPVVFSGFDGFSGVIGSSGFVGLFIKLSFTFIKISFDRFSFLNSVFPSDAVISSIVISVFPTFALVFAFNLISKISWLVVSCLLITLNSLLSLLYFKLSQPSFVSKLFSSISSQRFSS